MAIANIHVWFEDYDPTNTKLYYQIEYLDSEGRKVFTDEVETSVDDLADDLKADLVASYDVYGIVDDITE